MPDENSNNVEEQINYNYLRILKKKYNKYLDDNLLEKKPLKKKIIIKEIIQIGSSFDLWNYDFISKDNSNNNKKNSDNERKDLLSVFKIEGILRNFSDLYNRVEELNPKLPDEEKLLEYLQAMQANGNKIIPQNSSSLFSDGTQKGYYWSSTKDKIYKMITEEGNPFVIQHKDQCEVLIKEYNKKQLGEEEKLLEYLQSMKENGNKILSSRSQLLFSNGEKMAYYWSDSNNKDKIYNMIIEEGNPFVIQYKDQCEVLIKEYNKYQEKQKSKITEEEKLFEYLQAMKDNGNKILSSSSSLLFSDGKKMNHYWSANNNKDKIYKRITEEGNQFIIKYKDQCEVLIKKYNKKDLSDEEKLLEYLQAMKDKGNKIIPYNSPLLFSDGTQKGYYWSINKEKIYKMIIKEENQFIVKYKEQCEVLIKEYNKKQLSDEEKLYEYLQAMRENGNKIIPKISSLLFSDGTQMGYYCVKCKDKIYKMITEENQFIVKYKEQCEVLIKEYNTHQEKQKTKITEEEKLLEYLQAVKENDDKIILRSSPLLFSDGTQISSYWKCNKDKIYKMIAEEGNPFVVKYKEQCEVLINEYIKSQERKKKKQEKYKESESDFREESSYDKTLKNEKGKYSNEGKKVL